MPYSAEADSELKSIINYEEMIAVDRKKLEECDAMIKHLESSVAAHKKDREDLVIKGQEKVDQLKFHKERLQFYLIRDGAAAEKDKPPIDEVKPEDQFDPVKDDPRYSSREG